MYSIRGAVMVDYRGGGRKIRLFKNHIPVPADPELRQAYLDYGWIEVPAGMVNPAMLVWSYARGSPRHPGIDEPPEPRKPGEGSWH